MFMKKVIVVHHLTNIHHTTDSFHGHNKNCKKIFLCRDVRFPLLVFLICLHQQDSKYVIFTLFNLFFLINALHNKGKQNFIHVVIIKISIPPNCRGFNILELYYKKCKNFTGKYADFIHISTETWY